MVAECVRLAAEGAGMPMVADCKGPDFQGPEKQSPATSGAGLCAGRMALLTALQVQL